MVTKGSKATGRLWVGHPCGQASMGTVEILAFEACRNGQEKVDCRGTALASENGAKTLHGWEKERHAQGLDPGDFAGSIIDSGRRLLLLLLGARPGGHFGT